MKLSLPVVVIILLIALLVGGAAVYVSLSPRINKEKARVKNLQAELKELEELVETDATKINGNMWEIFEHIEEVEEELEKNSLKGVAHDAEELAEYAENISKLTPPKGKEQISTYRKMANDLKKDSEELEKAAKAKDLGKAKEAVEKIETGCGFCHDLFLQTDEDIHPEEHTEAATPGR